MAHKNKPEEETREIERRYRALCESSMDAIFFFDMEGYVIDANPSGLDLLGYSREEINSLTNDQLTAEQWRTAESEIVKNQVMPKGQSDEYKKEYIRRDGTLCPVATKSWLMKDERGRPAGIWAISRSISEPSQDKRQLRKKAEDILRNKEMLSAQSLTKQEVQELVHEFQVHEIELEMQNDQLRQSQHEIEESHARYSDLYDFAPVGYFTFDSNGIILEMNLSGASMLMRERVALINKPLSSYIHKDDQDIFFLHRRKVLKSGERQTCELRIIKPDKSLMYAQIESISDREGHIRTSISDIAQRKAMEQEFLKSSKLESLGTLAGGIAHDFNNLLAGLMGNIMLSKMHTDPASPAYQKLEEAEKVTMRAKGLTDQLLTFSSGGAPVKKTVYINSLLKESAMFALSGTRIRCDFSIPDDLWPVNIDEGQIVQVINNLVINAEQAMPEGGTIKMVCNNIVVGANHELPLPEGKYIMTSIKDSGVGIPADLIDKVLDPYFTTKQKGSGLGLATSYFIISNHQGRIIINSLSGRGTTMHVYLPASEMIPSRQIMKDTIIHGSGRVLVMDDNESIRVSTAAILSTLGYEAACAPDGQSAIEMYTMASDAGKPYDIVILDLTVAGGMGGKETIKKLLEIDPKVRAIVSSGYSSEPVMSDYKSFGFSGVLPKPVNMDEFSREVHRVKEDK